MSELDWDEDNSNHIREHGVSSIEAQQVVINEPFDLEFQTKAGEDRFVQLGETNGGRILIVVSTWRGTKIRVITAYDAPKALKHLYIIEKGKYGGDPQDPSI
jgi:uncharacterized DUF497 family protein